MARYHISNEIQELLSGQIEKSVNEALFEEVRDAALHVSVAAEGEADAGEVILVFELDQGPRRYDTLKASILDELSLQFPLLTEKDDPRTVEFEPGSPHDRLQRCLKILEE